MKRAVVALACVLLAINAPGSGAKKKPAVVTQADQIVIVNSERTLALLRQGKVMRTYKVALGTEPRGAKTQRGDNRTPEGEYVIDTRNAHSQFHLSLHVSYPNTADRARAARLGVNPGGDIMIHGLAPA